MTDKRTINEVLDEIETFEIANHPDIPRLVRAVRELVGAVEYYARSNHFEGDWENPSGEPENLLCLNETDEWHWIESGEVARVAEKKALSILRGDAEAGEGVNE